jgi:hypothetical protein
MKITKNLLSKIVCLCAISANLFFTGCGITASGLDSHAGYADVESPYWWQADSELNLSLGPLAIGSARWIIDEDEDPEIDALLDEIDGVRISIYKVADNSKIFKDNLAETQANLRADGWEHVVRVNDNDSADYSLMFIKSNGEVIDGLVVLTLSDDEAVFVNIIGNIHPDSFDPIMEKIYKKNESVAHLDE